MTLTLLRRHSELAQARRQVELLEADSNQARFDDLLTAHDLPRLQAESLRVLQLNLGKLCNQTCRHCHVDAGPDRRELMTQETMRACLQALEIGGFETVDLTGGAPEMNPHFRGLVQECRQLGRHVIDRCNLTILLAPGYEDLPSFLSEQQVEIVASLPCYLEDNVDRQRGDGVFDRSIEALKRLNAVGYGRADSGLTLTLVFNPGGPKLPPPQANLEDAYRRELQARYGIEFSRLFTITNMPISRFLDDLLQTGQYEAYLQKLIDSFNLSTVSGVMCRSTLSVDWQGRLFDCDFNQMLELPLMAGQPQTIQDFNADRLASRTIVTGRHCFGCTAGAGSSCQGAVAN